MRASEDHLDKILGTITDALNQHFKDLFKSHEPDDVIYLDGIITVFSQTMGILGTIQMQTMKKHLELPLSDLIKHALLNTYIEHLLSHIEIARGMMETKQ